MQRIAMPGEKVVELPEPPPVDHRQPHRMPGHVVQHVRDDPHAIADFRDRLDQQTPHPLCRNRHQVRAAQQMVGAQAMARGFLAAIIGETIVANVEYQAGSRGSRCLRDLHRASAESFGNDDDVITDRSTKQGIARDAQTCFAQRSQGLQNPQPDTGLARRKALGIKGETAPADMRHIQCDPIIYQL